MGRRVLICTWGFGDAAQVVGGAERQARLQAEEFRRRGYRVTIVCPRLPGSRPVRTEGGALEVLPLAALPTRRLRSASYCAALAGFLLRHGRRFDQIFVHHAYLQADVVVSLGRVLRRPVWVRQATSGHGSEIGRMRRVARLTRYVGFRKAYRVQAISDDIASELRAIAVPEERIALIPNGVDTRAYRPSSSEERRAARSRLGLPDGAVVVLFAGRIARAKGVEELARAWTVRHRPGAHLVLLGREYPQGHPARAVLPTTDASLELRPWTVDPTDHYRAADVFVLPSISEGMSNALLEAMASGLAVIATRVGAAESMIEEGISGLLIPPGDVRALAAALDRLLADGALRRDLGAAAARVVSERYGIGAVVDRIVAASPALQPAA